MAEKRRLNRARRLSGKRRFARVFGGRCSAGNKLLVVYAHPNDLPYSRMGLVVGRKCGKAVVRNRIKRLLRESFRLECDKFPPGFDLVFIPSAGRIGTLGAYRQAIRTGALRAVARCQARSKGNR